MSEPVKRLPDVDSIKGMGIEGAIIKIQYQNARDESWYELSMTLPNAQFLLSMLSDLPDADRIFQNAREFRRRNPIR